MSKYRILRVRCNESASGCCHVVERKGWFGWAAALIEWDRGGRRQAVHFSSRSAAHYALATALNPDDKSTVVAEYNSRTAP